MIGQREPMVMVAFAHARCDRPIRFSTTRLPQGAHTRTMVPNERVMPATMRNLNYSGPASLETTQAWTRPEDH